MRQEDEQGFLSGKFDDWSGEPIPNGWNSLEQKLKVASYRRKFLIAGLPLLFLLPLFFGIFDQNKPVSNRQTLEQLQDLQARSNSANRYQQVPGAPDPAFRDLSSKSSVEQQFPAKTPTVRAVSSNTAGIEKAMQNASSGETIASSETREMKNPFSFSGEETPVSVDEPDDSRMVYSEMVKQETINNFALSGSSAGILPLALKSALPVFPESQFSIHPIPEKKSYESISKMPGPGFQKSFSVQAAYAVSSARLNHARTEGWKYGIRSNQFSSAGLVSAGFRMDLAITRNFGIFYGIESGIWMRQMELIASSRTPQAYVSVQSSSSSFKVSPQITSATEQRRSLLVFARPEIGIRKAFTRRTGILASAQIWARLASKGSSDLENAATFGSRQNAVLPGYRIGLWWQAGPFSQAELSFSASPESLSPSTPGMEFNSRLISLGLRQSF